MPVHKVGRARAWAAALLALLALVALATLNKTISAAPPPLTSVPGQSAARHVVFDAPEDSSGKSDVALKESVRAFALSIRSPRTSTTQSSWAARSEPSKTRARFSRIGLGA